MYIKEYGKKWRKKNKEKIRAYMAEWKKKNKEHVAEYNESRKEFEARKYRENIKEYKEKMHKNYLKNKDSYKENSKIWKRANPEKVAISSSRYARKHKEHRNAMARKRYKKWYAEHKEHVLNRARQYRANKFNAPGSHTVAEWMQLKERFGFSCAACGDTKKKLHPDHIIPLTKGGSNYIDNIQPLCISCNSSKKNFRFTDYRKRGTIMKLMRSWFPPNQEYLGALEVSK